MRIAFAARRPVHPFILGGAEVSIHVLFNALARLGHTCLLLGELHDDPRTRIAVEHDSWPERVSWRTDAGVHVSVTGASSFERFLCEQLGEFEPDWLLTQLDGALEALLWAQQNDTARMFFVRDVANPYNWTPFTTPWIDRASLLVSANSRYVQRHLREQWNIESSLLYPPIECVTTPPAMPLPPRRLVLFVNPAPSKGGRLVCELAARMREFMFHVVEGWQPLDSIPWSWPRNVTLVKAQPALDSFFDIAGAVIVPSQQPEGFCRVAAEAQARGRPVLASNHSGLAEAVGTGGILIDDYQSLDAWEHALRRVFADASSYRSWAEKAWLHSARFEAGAQALLFLNCVARREAA